MPYEVFAELTGTDLHHFLTKKHEQRCRPGSSAEDDLGVLIRDSSGGNVCGSLLGWVVLMDIGLVVHT